MRTRITRRPWPLAASALFIIAIILTACSGTSHDMTNMNQGSGATPSAMAGMGSMEHGSIDQMFIDMMVPHHQGAVEMAKIAQTRGEHPETKGLAGNIIASQTSEIGQMKQWRKAWFGDDGTPPMDQMPTMPGMNMTAMNGMNMTQDIKALQTASPFDKAFIQAMIPHHQSAIDAAKIEQGQGQHQELKTLAGAIITAQQKEIDQMQGWLKAWYGQ